MVEAESGCITIDGVDISKLGLRHLRSQMSIIPQVRALRSVLVCTLFNMACVQHLLVQHLQSNWYSTEG